MPAASCVSDVSLLHIYHTLTLTPFARPCVSSFFVHLSRLLYISFCVIPTQPTQPPQPTTHHPPPNPNPNPNPIPNPAPGSASATPRPPPLRRNPGGSRSRRRAWQPTVPRAGSLMAATKLLSGLLESGRTLLCGSNLVLPPG